MKENYYSKSLETILLEFKKEFENFLSNKVVKLLKDSVQEVYQPALYSLLNGGKRIRPILLLLVSNYDHKLKKDKKFDILYTASAVEVLHTYTLIHDDLPAMDNDPIRRGKPSCHIEFPEWSAILAGDTLNTFAFYLLSLSKYNIKKKLEILSLNLGHLGVIAGQALDLSNEKKDFKVPTTNYDFIFKILSKKKFLNIFKQYLVNEKFLQLLSIHYLKTAIFFKSIMELGIYSGKIFKNSNQNKKKIEIFKEYGETIGLLFQIQDDLLDEIGEEKKVGKKLHKDKEKGKLTFPSLFGIEETQKIATELSHYSILLAQNFPSFPYKKYFIDLPNFLLHRNQ